ncbi:MAG: winged helix-turn-helix domain-containing protein [Christensenella sp.]|nr:winged helix-turn-helix domain-containing protein [Christensenella sp.]
MPKVKVFMLGRFEIVANGTEVIKSLGSSKKRIVLLEYLILNRDKPILMKDLFEVLWPGENSTNPESALKTLVSRLRATLSDYSPDLSDCIITERGGYRWNPALDCEIDVFSFEAACNDVLRAASLTPEVRAQAATLMTLYAGELLPNSDMDAWVVARSVFLHNMYLKAVQHYIVLLKGEGAHDEIAQVCRLALDVDAFDATLNLELMTALLKIGRSSEALAQYNHATDLHYNHLGIQPPEGMLEFYKKLIKIDNASKTDIDSIRAELCADDTRSGAFVCEYVIFKDIYQLHMRNLSRLGTTMFIALITISSMGDKPVEPLMLDKLMRLLLSALQNNLRRGDTISRYNSTQYAVLLPSVSYETGRIPLERVKKAFYKMYSNPSFVVSYRLAPIAADE